MNAEQQELYDKIILLADEQSKLIEGLQKSFKDYESALVRINDELDREIKEALK